MENPHGSIQGRTNETEIAETVATTLENPIQVRANGVALPHTIMNQDRRITHAAITENKRLGAVLAHIKAEQDKVPPKVQVKPDSARNGYKKTGKRPPGRASKMEPYYARKRAERELRAASQSSDI